MRTLLITYGYFVNFGFIAKSLKDFNFSREKIERLLDFGQYFFSIIYFVTFERHY